ncbi:CDP-alcohol phosphatidyltransferase family protein [Glycomyces albus]
MSRAQWRTVPNLVTLARFALIAPIMVLLVTGAEPLLVASLTAVFAATDWVDGWMARRLDQVTSVGRVLDPLADRIGLAGIAVALAVVGAVPWWLIAVFPAVDLVVGAALAILRRPLSVSRIGKIRTAVVLVGVFAVVVGTRPGLEAVLAVGRAGLAVAALLHVAAGAGYLRRLVVQDSTRASTRSATGR